MRKNTLTILVGAASTVVLATALIIPAFAESETYVGAQIGFSIPASADIFTTGATGGGTRVEDVKLTNSFAFGAKAGHYFEGLKSKWIQLGIESDFYTHNPSFKGQTAKACNANNQCGNGTVVGSSTRANTWAWSLMARIPDLVGGRLQPYAGMGLGFNFMKQTTANVSKFTDTALGLHVVTGLRFMVTKEVGVFGEYKYDRFSYGSDNTGTVDMNIHLLMAGVSYHFFTK